MIAVCMSLFQGFLQKSQHSGLSQCGKDHCCVLLSGWKLWLQDYCHGNVLEWGNKKFLQRDNEPVQDVTSECVSGGLRGFG